MNAFLSFINGFIYTALLFILCLVFTIGTKWLFLSIKARLIIKAKKEQPKPNPKPQKQSEHSKPDKKPLRTIEINTDDVEKIYFKKSS